MEILISVAIGFTFMIIALAMGYNSSQNSKIRIAKLQGRNQELTLKIRELESEIEVLRAENNAFTEARDNVSMSNVPVDCAPPPQAKAAGKSVVSTLLRQGHVTSEQVRKAQKYQQDNSSPYSIEEILVLLNMVSPAVVSEAKGEE